MSRTNIHGPKDVRAIEVRLYIKTIGQCMSYELWDFNSCSHPFFFLCKKEFITSALVFLISKFLLRILTTVDSLSRLRLSLITAYLEVCLNMKIKQLVTEYCGKEEKLL